MAVKLIPIGAFLDDNTQLAVSPLSALRELEHAFFEVESNTEDHLRNDGFISVSATLLLSERFQQETQEKTSFQTHSIVS